MTNFVLVGEGIKYVKLKMIILKFLHNNDKNAFLSIKIKKKHHFTVFYFWFSNSVFFFERNLVKRHKNN